MKLQNAVFPLPAPNDEELALIQPLLNKVCEEIDRRNGKMDFATFMEMALYTPDLGYYSSNKAIFGEQGDFITAPELTPMFSRCLANQIKEVLSQIEGGGNILEFGAGAGTMACDILMELDTLNCLPHQYLISEVSHTLRQRQRSRIETYAPHLINRVTWIDELPASFTGVMIGNEILDAIPTHRVRLNQNGKHEELFVGHENSRLGWVGLPTENKQLQSEMDNIFAKFGDSMPDAYETEININSNEWLLKISKTLKEGLALFIDYGFTESEYFRPERSEGTLMCHYKHCAHSDPLTHLGLQDITAHVNFTAVAEVAFNNEMTIAGFTNQTYFLVGCGLEVLLNEIDINDTKQFITETQPVKMLILPDEMGELFKVIGLTKNFDHNLMGFHTKNLMERL